jgi:hypothetical protein
MKWDGVKQRLLIRNQFCTGCRNIGRNPIHRASVRLNKLSKGRSTFPPEGRHWTEQLRCSTSRDSCHRESRQTRRIDRQPRKLPKRLAGANGSTVSVPTRDQINFQHYEFPHRTCVDDLVEWAISFFSIKGTLWHSTSLVGRSNGRRRLCGFYWGSFWEC